MKNPYAAPKLPEPEPVPASSRQCFCKAGYTCAWHLYGQDRQTYVPPVAQYNILTRSD
jgi:hypothetical protein